MTAAWIPLKKTVTKFNASVARPSQICCQLICKMTPWKKNSGTFKTPEEMMGTQSVFSCVNFKAMFGVALFATALTNFVFTQNLYTSLLDDTRNVLMSYSSGSPSPKPTSGHAGVVLLPPAPQPAPGGFWGLSRRRRRRSSSHRVSLVSFAKPTSTPAPPPVKKRTSPSNKFLEALDQIERAVYEAQAAGSRYRHSNRRLAKIKANIKLATQKRNYLFARQSLGHGLYSVMQLAKTSGRKRSAPPSSAAVKKFMDSIKTELGKSAFDTFMSVNGEVTLMFAIDDTGSMGEEIDAAKAIATSIVRHDRDETAAVDYILSPFNDPGTGPVTYRSSSERDQFVNDIGKLRHHGGGDCPELTFKGILDALLVENPQCGSPLYVFTDATAKDYTEYKLEEVLAIAADNDITINFFTTGLCGLSSYHPFEKMAKETCGQIFNLPTGYELRKLAGVTAGALAGATCLATGGAGNASGKKKRSLHGSYSIPIDDSTEKIIISVTTERRGPSITLKDPRGFFFTSGKISLSKGAIYEINHPRPGTWKLTVSGAGKHTYQVKGSSKTNIDFEHFFIMIPTRGRNKKPIPISHPLLGKKALVIVTVAGAKKVNSKTLQLDLISKDGKRLGTTAVSPRGKSGAHFSASFTPPLVPFKLKLRGKTNKGYSFERNSRNIVHPSHALIRVLYARNEFTVPSGGSGFVMFVVYNTGPTEVFDIKVKNRRKYVMHLRRALIIVRQGRKSYFPVSFKAPSSAARGESNEVLATITGRKSKKTVGQVVRLMVV